MSPSAEQTRGPVVLAAVLTVALAAACWVTAVREMRGMDMGGATSLGSTASFIGIWMSMMAAMMLPAALPTIAGVVRERSRLGAGLWFVASYLAVWLAFGIVAHGVYRPHGHAVAGVTAILAGLYERSPLKRRCRERCREPMRSGGRFGFYCVGSTCGLMLMLLGLGAMNMTLMVGVAAIVLAQKLLPPRAVVDGTLALAIVAVGMVVVMFPTFSV